MNKNMWSVKNIFFVFLCVLFLAGTVIISGIKYKDVYAQSYYAALPKLYEKLDITDKEKIIIIGNSSVAFGVDSQLLEKLISESGHDYSVCNFGLYGAIGTRAMLELSLDVIEEGDIVIYMPEASEQSQSLYFSASEMWKAIDGDKRLLWKLDSELKAEMIANYPMYIYEKSRISGKNVSAAVYDLGSFDDNMDLTVCDREYNIMDDGVDYNNIVNLDKIQPDEDYYDYISCYYEKVRKRGAQLLFMYGPVNVKALSGNIDDYCERVKKGYAFPVLGDFNESALDSEWFYDSNFHLNSSGMTVFTVLAVNNLKNWWGDSSVTEYSLPDKPQKDTQLVEPEGDNSDEEYFEYEEYQNGYRVSGLTDEGKERGQLTIPVFHNGKIVDRIMPGAFSQADNLKTIIIQSNIRSLPDYIFAECSSLKAVKLMHASPEDISVGYHLLAGISAEIYVPEKLKNAYKNNYFWGYYAEKIEGYE